MENDEKNKKIDKKVILVVDDDIMLLKLYDRLFARKGVKIEIARDGEEGLEMVKEQRPDFVILDIRMPKLNGIDVLKLLRADRSLKDLPVLVLTNFPLDEYKEEVESLGVVDFLVKANTDPMALVDKVLECVSQKKT